METWNEAVERYGKIYDKTLNFWKPCEDERTGRMTKLIDAELIIEELEKIIQLVKDADGVKVVPMKGGANK